MSLDHRFTVWCDLRIAKQCQEWVGTEHTGKEARAVAARALWRTVKIDGKNMDACPACAREAMSRPVK